MFTKNSELWDECFKDFDEDTYCGLTLLELTDIYIEWLQAVVEEDKEPCEYCDGEKYCSTKRLADCFDLPNSDYATLGITKEGLSVQGSHSDGYRDIVKIEYCPKCGRKL